MTAIGAAILALALAVYFLLDLQPRLVDLDARLIERPISSVAGPAVLTVDGAIAKTNADEDGVPVMMLDADALARLPQTTVRTETKWTDGLSAFTGVLGRDLMAAADARGSTIARALAVNDYWADIPVDDFLRYDVLLATSVDGAPLTEADRGPVWVIYPETDNPRLDAAIYHSRSVWQVVRVTFRKGGVE